MLNNLIAEYNNAQAEIKRLVKEKIDVKKACNDERDKIGWKYKDLIRDLESKSSSERHVWELKIEKAETDYNLLLQPHNKTVKLAEKIYTLMEIAITEENSFNPQLRKSWDKKEYTLIDTIADEKHLKGWVYIESNNKPKNKFSLWIKLRSTFQFAFDDMHMTGKMRCAPTQKELKEWYETYKNKTQWKWHSQTFHLNDVLTDHKIMEQEYKEAKELWNDPKWVRAYWLNKKEFYIRHYSGGINTDEYKDIIIILDTPHKDTALLVGQMKSELGKRELERRLQYV